MDSHLQQAIKKITKKREFSLHFQKAAVMLKVDIIDKSSSKVFTGAEILDKVKKYEIQEKDAKMKYKHFWLHSEVSCQDPYLIIHHGFELAKYGNISQCKGTHTTESCKEIVRLLRVDVKEIVDCLEEDHDNKLMSSIYGQTLQCEVKVYDPNPKVKEKQEIKEEEKRGEGEYWTVILIAQPTQELKYIHEALYKAFPHTRMFPDWSVHIASVADEKSANILKERLHNVEIRVASESIKTDFILRSQTNTEHCN
jgi:hypothetical protein